MTHFEEYIEHHLKKLIKNPNDTLQEIFKSKFFSVITHGIIQKKCPKFALKVVNALHTIVNTITTYEMYTFLKKKELGGELCLKFVYNIHRVYLLEHIAKIMCNSKHNLNQVRNLITSIMITIEFSNEFMSTFTRKLYIASLGKLFLDSFLTRHMLVSITYMDVLNLQKSKNINIVVKNTNLNSELNLDVKLNDILSRNDFEFHVSPVTLNNQYPKYVSSWSNKEKDIITITTIGLFPILIRELMLIKRPLPDLKGLKTILKETFIMMKNLKNLKIK